MKKNSGVLDLNPTTGRKNNYDTSVHGEPNLADFLSGTSDDVQKKVSFI